MTFLHRLIVFILLIGSMSVSANERVSIQLKWLHQFQFAGYYAALEKGFYAEEGLDVTLKERDPARNNVEQVLHGESEYGIADSVLLLYQARKEPIVIVAPIFQHSPNVLITLKKSGIDSPYKLIGKKVAFYPNDADGLPLLAMLFETGVMQKGFKRINTNFDIDALIRGDVDAHHGYITNEPFALLQRGIETNVINPLNFGVDLYGDMLFTTQTEMKNHPSRVAAIKRATIRGWEYALTHKDEIIRLIQSKYAPSKTFQQLRYEADGIASVVSAATIPIGTLDTGRLEYTQSLLLRQGLIDSAVPLSHYIYREAQARRSVYLTPEEQLWLSKHPVIRIVSREEWKPFDYTGPRGEYEGIAADYLALITQKLGIRFEPVPAETLKGLDDATENRVFDMLPCIVTTPKLEPHTLFTEPYYEAKMVIATDESVHYIDNVDHLKNKTVAVIAGDYAEDIFMRFYPDIPLLSVNSPIEGLKAVSEGEAFAYVDAIGVITDAIRNGGFSNLKISGEIPYDYRLSMGVRNDWPELVSILQKALNSITPQERERIRDRHIQIEYTQTLSWQQLAKFFVPLVLIVILLLYYNRKQHRLNQTLSKAMNDLERTKSDLEAANEQLRSLSITDQLTGLANRRRLDETLQTLVAGVHRYNRPFSAILIDLDWFKHVNDLYGHQTGDMVLKRCSDLIRSQIRKTDTIGRWGGEEFLILCPETTLTEAKKLAEKLRQILSDSSITGTYTQTASFGVCQYDLSDLSGETLISRVDRALYEAKNSGRNCVCVHSVHSPQTDGATVP